jgi:glutamate--cysteine ligase
MAPPSPLTLERAHALVARRCAAVEGPGDRVGIELEWPVVDPTRPTAAVPHEQVADELVTRSLPAGGRVSFEPGGQLELSTRPVSGLAAACRAAADDVVALQRRLGARGIALAGLGMDPARSGRRVVRTARYDAMEMYFDRLGPDGRTMMRRTAAVQVNVDGGSSRGEANRRWRVAHRIGPALTAAFANSPLVDGRPSGWRSARLATWLAIDPTRTTSAFGAAPDPPGDLARDWSAYALAAHVMLIRTSDGRQRALDRPLPFATWITDGHHGTRPSDDDLEYHLTTLFPPVRPRGWLEVRMIDALPDPWWEAAVATMVALTTDEEAGARAEAACAGTELLWREAARDALSHPRLAAAARECVAAALDALPRVGGDDLTSETVGEYHDRYTAVGRSPADDRLDEWAATGQLLPAEPPRAPTWS